MKRKLCYLLIVALCIMSFVGCGNKKNNNDIDTENSNTSISESEIDENQSEISEEQTASDDKGQNTEQADKQETVKEDAHKHNYKETVKNASCTGAGSKTFTCTTCGDTYSETIPALEHSYNVTNTTSATCASEGSKTYTCSKCKNSYVEKIPMESHSWIDATCNSAKRCSVCGKTEGTTLSHNYSGGKCTMCGTKASLSLEYVMAAYALRDLYNAAKFPDTLSIQRAYYTTDNGAGNPVVVLRCSAANSAGGNSLCYSRAMKDPDPDSDDYNYNNEYYIDIMVSNSDPYMSYANYSQIDIQKCYEAYNILFGN